MWMSWAVSWALCQSPLKSYQSDRSSGDRPSGGFLAAADSSNSCNVTASARIAQGCGYGLSGIVSGQADRLTVGRPAPIRSAPCGRTLCGPIRSPRGGGSYTLPSCDIPGVGGPCVVRSDRRVERWNAGTLEPSQPNPKRSGFRPINMAATSLGTYSLVSLGRARLR